MILEIYAFLITCACGGLVWVALRATRRMLQFDEVFQYLADDVETNMNQYRKMSNSVLMANEPEIEQAHKNMMIMAQRLDEISKRMEEVSGRELRKPRIVHKAPVLE